MVVSFTHMVAEFITYKQKVSFFPTQAGTSVLNAKWKPPPHGTLKINIDAHVVEGRYANVGVVVRNAAGTITLAAVKRLEGRWEVALAEAAAARYGLMVARRYGFENIWLEGDALEVVQGVRKEMEGFTPLHMLYDDIRWLLHAFRNFMFSHVKRAGNTVAHLMARRDTSENAEIICMDPFPQSLINLAELDLH